MCPDKPASAQDVDSTSTSPLLSIPKLNITSPMLPSHTPPIVFDIPPLFSSIGEQEVNNIDMDTESTSTKALQDKMEKLNMTCMSFFLTSNVSLQLMGHCICVAAPSDTFFPTDKSMYLPMLLLLFVAHVFLATSGHQVTQQAASFSQTVLLC